MKKLALGALAMIAGGFGMSTVASQIANSNIQKTVRYDQRNQNRDSQPLQRARIAKSAETIKSQTSYSASGMFNQGIPPKIYGMSYVRRGTHKRTNI